MKKEEACEATPPAAGKKAEAPLSSVVFARLAREIKAKSEEVFLGSPLKDKGLESTVLRYLACSALSSGAKIEEVRAKPEELSVNEGWKVYIESYSSLTGNTGVTEHLKVDESGALFASPELAAFMKSRIFELSGLHKL